MIDGTKLLTGDELAIVDLLRDATNRFSALPEHHPCDYDEWVSSVHVLQRQVMARAARRAFPERFPAMHR